jgi:hypothetical protein
MSVTDNSVNVFIAKVEASNPNEPEFIQAVKVINE